MEAYETSTSTLAKILANPKLDAEYIASTTDALADTLADAHEIDEAIQVGGRVAVGLAGNAAVFDEDELAGELEELVKEERERSERERAASQQREREQKDKAGSGGGGGKGRHGRDKTQKADDKGSSASKETVTSAEWQKRYDDAQQRDKEEKARAEEERMKRDDARMVAEYTRVSQTHARDELEAVRRCLSPYTQDRNIALLVVRYAGDARRFWDRRCTPFPARRASLQFKREPQCCVVRVGRRQPAWCDASTTPG